MITWITDWLLTAGLLHLQALPESLRYLLAAGQNVKATDILSRMSSSRGKPLPEGRLTASAAVCIYPCIFCIQLIITLSVVHSSAFSKR